VPDIVDFGAVGAGNDALLQLLRSRKISKIYLQSPSSQLHQSFTNASHVLHTEFYQV